MTDLRCFASPPRPATSCVAFKNDPREPRNCRSRVSRRKVWTTADLSEGPGRAASRIESEALGVSEWSERLIASYERECEPQDRVVCDHGVKKVSVTQRSPD